MEEQWEKLDCTAKLFVGGLDKLDWLPAVSPCAPDLLLAGGRGAWEGRGYMFCHWEPVWGGALGRDRGSSFKCVLEEAFSSAGGSSRSKVRCCC